MSLSSVLAPKRTARLRAVAAAQSDRFLSVGYGFRANGTDDYGHGSANVRGWLDSLSADDRTRLTDSISANLRPGNDSDRYFEFCARVIDAYRADAYGITGTDRHGNGHTGPDDRYPDTSSGSHINVHERDTVRDSRGWLSPVGVLRWHLVGSGLPTWPVIDAQIERRFPTCWGRG